MTYKEKKEILWKIKNLHLNGGENIGTMFFFTGKYTGLLKGFVYGTSIAYGLDVEAISLEFSLFVGTKEHAFALKEALGGRVGQTEHCRYRENPRDLWVWHGPLEAEQCRRSLAGDPLLLDKEAIKEILF